MCILFVNTILIYCTQWLTADQGLTHCMQLNFTVKISKVHECVTLCGIVPMVVILHEYVLVECQELKAKSTCTYLVPSYAARVTTEGLTHTWSSYHCEAHTWMSYQLTLDRVTTVRLTLEWVTSSSDQVTSSSDQATTVRLTHCYANGARLTHCYAKGVRLTHTWMLWHSNHVTECSKEVS